MSADTALPVIGAFIYERLLDVINLVPGEDYGAPAITIAQRLIEILTPDSAPERPDLDLGEVRAERLSTLLGRRAAGTHRARAPHSRRRHDVCRAGVQAHRRRCRAHAAVGTARIRRGETRGVGAN